LPTLAARLDVALDGNDLAEQLSAQAGNLGGVAATVTGLISNPPAGVAGIAETLADLPVPDLDFAAGLGGMLGDLQDALPTDLSSLTGGLVGGLGELQTTVGTDLVGVLAGVLDAVLAIRELAQLDLRCLDVGGTAPGAGSAPPGGAGGGDPGANGGGGGAPAESSGPALTASAAARVDGLLDMLPSPLDTKGFLIWVHERLALPERDTLLPHTVPILDEIRDPLETLVEWDALDGEGIRTHFAATLSSAAGLLGSGVGGVLDDVVEALPETGDLQADDLARIADGITARLVELRSAVAGGDLSGTGPAVTELTALLDEYDALRPTLDLAALEEVSAQLRELPFRLEDRITLVSSAVEGSGVLSIWIEDLSSQLREDASAQAITLLQQQVSALIGWLQDFVAKIDLSAIQEPLATVSEQAQGVADALDGAVVTLTLEIQELFGQVEALLGQVDPAALQAQVEEAIDGFSSQLVDDVTALFEPARTAVAAVVDSIDDAVGAFDPEALLQPLRDALGAVTGLLEDPDVAAAMSEIREALDTATSGLEALSFTPVADAVIANIDGVAQTLETIETSLLPPPAQLALQTALSVLPEDLTAVTDPLVDNLGVLLESGPVPVLESLIEPPVQLKQAIQQFDPSDLVGEALSAPFASLVQQMDGFRPSALLEPVRSELDALKNRLRESARPGRLLEPLEPPFAQLLEAFDRLRPEEVVAPLDQAITSVIDDVLDTLPVDEVLDQVGDALDRIEEVTTMGTTLLAPVQRIRDALGAFAAAEDELTGWLDEILAKVEPLSADASLTAAAGELTEALDATTAGPLGETITETLGLVLAELATLDAQRRLTALVQAYRGISRQALAALPGSTEKTAVEAVLDRFDPLDPDFGAPYQSLADWREEVVEAQAALAAALADWDAQHHSADGALAGLRDAEAEPAQLAQAVREYLEPRLIAPLVALFAMTSPLGAAFDALISELERLVNDLTAKLSSILEGPGSLEQIRSSLQQLVDRLRSFDLGVLTESLTDLFADVRERLQAADPARIRELVDGAFDDMLSALDLDQIIPAADVKELDDSYAEVVDKLKGFDPQRLVTEVIKPEFEEDVIPLLDVLDVSGLIQALVERLRSLDEELKIELDRVNEAYQAFRRNMPSISIGVSVEVPF
jgi:hypothetical protein